MKKPTIPEVLPFCAAYYNQHSTGGNLHIVLDDENIELRSVQWCRDQAASENDSDGVTLAEMLMQMTISQRRRLTRKYAYAQGSAGRMV